MACPERFNQQKDTSILPLAVWLIVVSAKRTPHHELCCQSLEHNAAASTLVPELVPYFD